ncbi:MAG: N-acetylglucosamine-6-phosphate deacetylase, partial [Thiothrix sp.]|nr:N-acetylglucosamine-6-phosphate deacetylase [Thiothrix sp.]
HSWCGIIVDGIHLHPVTAALAIRAKARGRMVLVTDAMATIGSSRNYFRLYGETIRVQDGRCVNAEGALAGSALDMASAVRNCMSLPGLTLPEALRMASLYPAQWLGLDRERGRIAPGWRADLVLLNTALEVEKTWVGAEQVYARP